MQRFFALIAVSMTKPDEVHGLTRNAGWQRLNGSGFSDKTTNGLKAMSSSDACASRQAASENTLNADYRFILTEVLPPRDEDDKLARAKQMLALFASVDERANSEILAGNGGGARQLLQAYRSDVANLLKQL